MSEAQAATTAALIEQILYPTTNSGDGGTNELFQPDGLMIDTNGLWLEDVALVTATGAKNLMRFEKVLEI